MRTRSEITEGESQRGGGCGLEKENKPLPTTNCAATAMFLLFLHLPEHGVLFDLDETASFVLGEVEPKFLYALALLEGARAPYLATLCRGLRLGIVICAWSARLVCCGGVGRGW